MLVLGLIVDSWDMHHCFPGINRAEGLGGYCTTLHKDGAYILRSTHVGDDYHDHQQPTIRRKIRQVIRLRLQLNDDITLSHPTSPKLPITLWFDARNRVSLHPESLQIGGISTKKENYIWILAPKGLPTHLPEEFTRHRGIYNLETWHVSAY